MTEAYKRTKRLHDAFLSKKEEVGWDMLQGLLLKDAIRNRVRRLDANSELDLENSFIKRESADKILAAEIFPDRNPMEIMIAELESDTHNELRDKRGTFGGEKRLSGEVVSFEGVDFLMIDKFRLERDDVSYHGEASVRDILEFVLEQGYVPVNANFEVVPFPENS